MDTLQFVPNDQTILGQIKKRALISHIQDTLSEVIGFHEWEDNTILGRVCQPRIREYFSFWVGIFMEGVESMGMLNERNTTGEVF